MDAVDRHALEPDTSFDGDDLDCGNGLLLLIRQHIDPLERGQLLEFRSTEISVPGAQVGTAMVNPRVHRPRVHRLMRSPRPQHEWHAGELETALMLSIRPGLVRRGLARRLPPVWLDFRASLGRGARRFREIDRRATAAGYFGWPAAARAAAGRRVMALRGRLIASEIVAALGRWRPPRRGHR